MKQVPSNDHWRRRGRGLLQHDGGAAAVEFALVLPILLVMLMGIVEFGRAWNRQQVITDTAREGARRAVVRDGLDKQVTVPAVVQGRLAASGMAWNGSVTGYAAACNGWTAPAGSTTAVVVSGCGWGADTGSEARVVITAPYPFDMLRPVMTLLPGDGTVNEKVLTTNFVMRNE